MVLGRQRVPGFSVFIRGFACHRREPRSRGLRTDCSNPGCSATIQGTVASWRVPIRLCFFRESAEHLASRVRRPSLPVTARLSGTRWTCHSSYRTGLTRNRSRPPFERLSIRVIGGAPPPGWSALTRPERPRPACRSRPTPSAQARDRCNGHVDQTPALRRHTHAASAPAVDRLPMRRSWRSLGLDH